MGLFDKKNKVDTTEPTPTPAPTQTVEATTPPIEDNNTSLSAVNMDNNPFVEAPQEVVEEELPTEPQVSFDNIFNASSEDLIPPAAPSQNPEVPVMQDTAATIDNPEPAPGAVEALKVNPTDMIGDTTIEDEITQIISDSVDPAPSQTPVEKLEEVEEVTSTDQVTETLEATPEPVNQESTVTEVPTSEPTTMDPEPTSAPVEQIESIEPVEPLVSDSEVETIPTESIDNPVAEVTPEPIEENVEAVIEENNLNEEPLVAEVTSLEEEPTPTVEESTSTDTEPSLEQPTTETTEEFNDIADAEAVIPEEVLASQKETEEVMQAAQDAPSEEPVLELTSNPPVEPAFVTPQESIMSSGVEESIISVPPLKSETTTESEETAEPVVTESPVEITPIEPVATEDIVAPSEPEPVPETTSEPVPTTEEVIPTSETVTEEDSTAETPNPENPDIEPVDQPSENELELPQEVELPIVAHETEENVANENEVPTEDIAENPVASSEESNETSEPEPSSETEEEPNRPIIEESETVILPVITDEMIAEYVAEAHPTDATPEPAPVEPTVLPEYQHSEPEEPTVLLEEQTPETTHPEENILPSVEEVDSNEQDVEIANDIPKIDEPVIPEEPTYDAELPTESEPDYSDYETNPIVEEPTDISAPNIIPPVDSVISEEPSVIPPIGINEQVSPDYNRPEAPSRPTYPKDFVYPKEPTPAMIHQKQNRPQLTERDGIVAYISDPTPTRFCNNCGVMLTDDSSICPSCGEPID